MLKIVTIVGARPQFIKAAPLSKALAEAGCDEVLLHTGQHYDFEMSEIFFEELGIPAPKKNLGIGPGRHGVQTGAMLAGIEEFLLEEKPDLVLLFGDTNSTLAGALAASKLGIPIAHVEAGLRSFNMAMPEEINRIVTDRLSALLFCPSQTAVDNLGKEGITQGVYLVGDVMADALSAAAAVADKKSEILRTLGLAEGRYLLATVHRAENTDKRERLEAILDAFNRIDETIVFPVHPRTRKLLDEMDFVASEHLKLLEPMGYLDMVMLLKSARMLLTDSGGMQKEAYWSTVPCITLRDETEWVETVEAKWNVLTGADTDRILDAVKNFMPPCDHPVLYGDGKASEKIAQLSANRD